MWNRRAPACHSRFYTLRGSLWLFALVAPPYLPLHHMEDCTRNIGYAIVKLRQGHIFHPFNNQDNF